MRIQGLPGALLLAGLAVASSAQAQFVSMARCRAAYPCSIPFSVQYRPDPLLAGQYGQPSHTALSGRIELEKPLKFELDVKPESEEAIDEAVRKSLELHPPAATQSEPEVQPVKPRRSPSGR